MNELFEIGATNAVLATFLAAAVWIVTRAWRHPAIAQALWVLVLVKLVTPPLIAIPWTTAAPSGALTQFEAVSAASETIEHDAISAGTVSHHVNDWSPASAHTDPVGNPVDERALPVDDANVASQPGQVASTAFSIPWRQLLLTIWLSGSIAYLSISLLRLGRFHRALRTTWPAGNALLLLANRAAERVGVAREFRLRTTQGRVAPLVWPIGRPTVLLSRPLLEQLSSEETESLVAHEFAHLRRRDHWVRWLELVVTMLYWWHPVVWWTRRNIQREEERACDAWVVTTFPEFAQQYATALFKAVQFAAEARLAPPPGLASRLTAGGDLKERIEHIMNSTWNCRLSLRVRLAMFAAAVAILPLSMKVVQGADDEPSPPSSATETAADDGPANQAEQSTSPPTEPSQRTSPSISPADPTDDKEPTQRIQTGMLLRIQVFGAPSDAAINSTYPVEPQGTVALGPLYGRVRIAGLTVAGAEAAVAKHLKIILASPMVQITIADRQVVRNAVDVPEDPYHIAPGDVVNITVSNAFADAPIADNFVVEPSGSVALGPQYGRVKVRGMTLEDAERAVVKHLEPMIEEPQVQVTIGGWQSRGETPGKSRATYPVDAAAGNLGRYSGDAADAYQPHAASKPEELEILREHIKFLEEQFKRVDAAYQTGSRGGSAEVRETAGYELALAKAELALAHDKRDEAMAELNAAVAHAEAALRSATASYETGRVTHDFVLQAARNLSVIKRKMLQVQHAPEARRDRVDEPTAERNLELARALAQQHSAQSTDLSIGVLSKIAQRSEKNLDRIRKLADKNLVSTSELDAAESDLEIHLERLRQAERALEYNRLLVELAEAEYQQAAEARMNAPNAVSQAELRKLKIKVELAKAKLRELSE